MAACMLGFLSLSIFLNLVNGDYTITVHPEYLAQNGRSHFESDRWNGHNGLDSSNFFDRNKKIGTKPSRWIHRDLAGDLFVKATQDPHHKGYVDPKYFSGHDFDKMVAGKYADNLKGFNNDLNVVMQLKGKSWPHWMDTSLHAGTFPNNLDAAADMILKLMQTVSRYTSGHIPKYFEVINEPDTLWKTVKWSTIVDYHRIVAAKLKKVFPKLKIGGPTYTGAINSIDKNNFRVWQNIREFLDMSLDHLDFFSFHPYDDIHVNGGSHEWSGPSEARLVGIIDLVESYAQHKRGKVMPLLTSEYGLGGNHLADHTSKHFAEWAYAYVHNSQMFIYLNFRGFMESAVAFLLSRDLTFTSASIYNHDGSYTNVAKAYQFWNTFNYNFQFLRVDSDYNGQERMVSPLALANPHSKEIFVLLHNYHQSETKVKINFDQHWSHSGSGRSNCFYLNSHKEPLLHESSVSVANNVVTVPAESTCYVAINFQHDFNAIPTIQEQTHYASHMVVPIHSHIVDMTVTVHNVGNIRYANLRIGVSTSNKGAQTKPKSVRVNGHVLTGNYAMYSPGKKYSETLLDMYVYQVPVQDLKENTNTVHLEFAQTGGFVSTAALVVGASSHSGSVVG